MAAQFFAHSKTIPDQPAFPVLAPRPELAASILDALGAADFGVEHSAHRLGGAAVVAKVCYVGLVVYDRKGFLPFCRNRKATERELLISDGTGITAGTPKEAERG